MMTSVERSSLENTARELLSYTKALYTEENPALTAAYELDFRTMSDAARRIVHEVDGNDWYLADEREKRNIRHELKNLLNLVVGFSQIILHEKEASPLTMMQYSTMQSVYQTGKKLLKLVNEELA